MHAQLRLRGIARHQRLERPHILRLPQQRQHTRLVRVPLVRIVRQAPLQTPRVVRERVARIVQAVAVHRREAVRPQVQRVVGKGAARHTPAARAGGQVHLRGGARVDDDLVRARVVERRPVPGQGRVAAVEDGRVGEPALGRLGPVPVREAPRVPALVAQGLLVLPDEPAVPAQEVGVEVDRGRLVDVRDDPVVEPGLGARGEGGRGLGLFALEAQDGGRVGYALVGGEIMPGEDVLIFHPKLSWAG